jgi:hypothetical protein
MPNAERLSAEGSQGSAGAPERGGRLLGEREERRRIDAEQERPRYRDRQRDGAEPTVSSLIHMKTTTRT